MGESGMEISCNVLFIMCDQLRFDYLSCYGHPYLKTPNIDWLASRGIRFTNAFVQSPICGPSRMSAYTGRYVRSHGSSANGVPLRVGEPTLGDHLKEIGVRTALIGKTHMVADREGMERLGVNPQSIIGVEVAQCGFEPYERDDGVNTDNPTGLAYDDYLRSVGYHADNPWEYWANSAEGPQGETLDGSLLSHADKPARVPDEHSETPYMTRRAMEFMRDAAMAGQQWCAHLSYIKPHWPYIVPSPYHALYGSQHIKPAIRSASEREGAHPVYACFQQDRVSRAFAKDEVRERVIPCYMGLIKQIDDQLGILFSFMEKNGLLNNTMIVFTSDHGDYLGDHWLGEKQLFHDQSVKVPLILYDPTPEADFARGTASDALVELIDLAPTFLDFLGGAAKPHILEGSSLVPLLHGRKPEDWRTFAVSEYDYAWDRARIQLDIAVTDCRMVMVNDGRWKYIEVPGFRPMLFDLLNDPDEFHDVGAEASCEGTRQRMKGLLLRWYQTARNRITYPDERIEELGRLSQHYDPRLDVGVKIGYWDESELHHEMEKRSKFQTRDTIRN